MTDDPFTREVFAALEPLIRAQANGWRCGACGWETFDIKVMHEQVNWPEADGVITLVCPECGTEGNFVDAETVPVVLLDGELVPLDSIPGVACPVCGVVDDVPHVHLDAEWTEGDPVPAGYVVVRCTGEGHDAPYTFLAPDDRAAACPDCLHPTGYEPDPDIDLGRLAGMNLLAGALGELARKVNAPLRWREDGWPLCPMCGEDELYAARFVGKAYPGTSRLTEESKIEMRLHINGCYRCGWTPRTVGPLATGLQRWEGGDGAPARLVLTGGLVHKGRSVGLSTSWGGGPGTFP